MESGDELNKSFESDQEFDSNYENYPLSTNKGEDHFNVSKGRKRMRLLTHSEDHGEETNERQNIES